MCSTRSPGHRALHLGLKDVFVFLADDREQLRRPDIIRALDKGYIDDCVHGIDLIMHTPELIATPINLGSSELVSINQLVSMRGRVNGEPVNPYSFPSAVVDPFGRVQVRTQIAGGTITLGCGSRQAPFDGSRGQA